MKNSTKWIAGIVVVALLFSVHAYNGFVTAEEVGAEKWSQIENQYQRRYDLIPNLVSTVKGYAAHETETLMAVVEARAKATQTNVNVKDAGSLAAFGAQQQGISSALSRLMVVVEKYPDLKANTNFLELQAQLEGTENRIAVARKDFNEAIRNYNIRVRRFPGNLLAKVLGFEKSSLFEVESEEVKLVPEVKF